MIFWIGFGVVWLLCALFTAGATVAYTQNRYPTIAKKSYRQDMGFGIGYGLLAGPLAVAVVLFATGFLEHGWSLKPLKDS
jgi:hypothetical protein